MVFWLYSVNSLIWEWWHRAQLPTIFADRLVFISDAVGISQGQAFGIFKGQKGISEKGLGGPFYSGIGRTEHGSGEASEG